jgi:hypothetical protein
VAIEVTDPRGLFVQSMQLLRRLRVEIAPYQLVIVSYNGETVIWDENSLDLTG